MNAADVDKLPGLKERDLTPCAVCGKPLTHDRSIAFYRVTIERFVLDPNAISRQVGLGVHLRSYALASIMGPNEDMAKQMSAHPPANVCDTCAITAGPIAYVDEQLADKAMAASEREERGADFDRATKP